MDRGIRCNLVANVTEMAPQALSPEPCLCLCHEAVATLVCVSFSGCGGTFAQGLRSIM